MFRYFIRSILDAFLPVRRQTFINEDEVGVKMSAADQCRSPSGGWRMGYLKSMVAWWRREYRAKAV